MPWTGNLQPVSRWNLDAYYTGGGVIISWAAGQKSQNKSSDNVCKYRYSKIMYGTNI